MADNKGINGMEIPEELLDTIAGGDAWYIFSTADFSRC